MKHRVFIRVIALVATIVLLILQLNLMVTAEEIASETENVLMEESSSTISYTKYKKQYSTAPRPDQDVVVDIMNQEGGSIITLSDEAGSVGVLTDDDGIVSWNISVPQTGWYNLQLTYHTQETKGSSIEREIRIDDELPFVQAASVTLFRVWNGYSYNQDAERIKTIMNWFRCRRKLRHGLRQWFKTLPVIQMNHFSFISRKENTNYLLSRNENLLF